MPRKGQRFVAADLHEKMVDAAILLPPKICSAKESDKPLKGILKVKKMPTLPRIDLDDNYNREDDDDIKLYNMNQILPFEDVRAYDGQIDKLSQNEQRYVIDKIRLGFELMQLEATRMQTKIDASNSRCEKLKELAQNQDIVTSKATYHFSQSYPAAAESALEPEKMLKKKKKTVKLVEELNVTYLFSQSDPTNQRRESKSHENGILEKKIGKKKKAVKQIEGPNHHVDSTEELFGPSSKENGKLKKGMKKKNKPAEEPELSLCHSNTGDESEQNQDENDNNEKMLKRKKKNNDVKVKKPKSQ